MNPIVSQRLYDCLPKDSHENVDSSKIEFAIPGVNDKIRTYLEETGLPQYSYVKVGFNSWTTMRLGQVTYAFLFDYDVLEDVLVQSENQYIVAKQPKLRMIYKISF